MTPEIWPSDVGSMLNVYEKKDGTTWAGLTASRDRRELDMWARGTECFYGYRRMCVVRVKTVKV